MTTKYTPGPWAFIVPDGVSVRHPQVYSDTGPICNATWLGDGRLKELEANARLIAAAPDLLEALIAMVEIAELTIGWLPTPPSADGPLIKARAVITKATGGAS